MKRPVFWNTHASILIAVSSTILTGVALWLAIRDITERKQSEDFLRDSRENLHRLLNSMAEGVYGVDTKGNCTFINQAFLQILGYQNENEVLGKYVYELIHHSHTDGSP